MSENAANDEGDDGSSSNGDDDDDEGVITEIRFVPGDKASCELLRVQHFSGKIDLPVKQREKSEVNLTHLSCVCVCFHAVDSMFSAMCECQALHPDPEDDDSDNDYEGEEYDVEEAGEDQHTHTNQENQISAPHWVTCIVFLDFGESAFSSE